VAVTAGFLWAQIAQEIRLGDGLPPVETDWSGGLEARSEDAGREVGDRSNILE
jgi:hypothetical protein